jgi:hypothetical protein
VVNSSLSGHQAVGKALLPGSEGHDFAGDLIDHQQLGRSGVSNEESCSFLKKRTKRLLLPDVGSRIRDLAGKYMAFQEGYAVNDSEKLRKEHSFAQVSVSFELHLGPVRQ